MQHKKKTLEKICKGKEIHMKQIQDIDDKIVEQSMVFPVQGQLLQADKEAWKADLFDLGDNNENEEE